jgi:hypothetical protein
MEVLLSTAYLPPVEWFAAYAQADAVWLEAEEHYLKQTYRNRCLLLNVSGSIELSLPVSKTVPNHCPIREMRISYAENWPRNHWRSIETSYSTSPYFLYYRDYLEPFFLRRYGWLWDFNLEMLSVLLRLFRLPEKHRLTAVYEAHPEGVSDFRALIHPKRRLEPDYPFRGQEPYRQVFAGQQPFLPNLSVLDLLCNLGPESAEYLKRQPLPAVAL